MARKKESQSFWLVLISDFRMNGGRFFVKGHFVYITMEMVESKRRLRFSWLTPEDKPFDFEMPKHLLPNKRLDLINAKDVEDKFIDLFNNTPVAAIPEAPIPIPIEKVPPGKRKKLMLAKKKQREHRIRERQDQ